MLIYRKNKHTLQVEEFFFKCAIGKNGISKNKVEGDKKTPKGIFKLGNLYYRDDRIKKIDSKLHLIKIRKYMGWCDDVKSKKKYNKLINTNEKLKHEKLFRKDHKYDLLIPIKYNFKKRVLGKGSCIFIHLTNNYKPTEGCITVSKTDFFIILKIINKKTKIKIF
tara:strand:- start:2811 stop:3305 length:495 start_codon:yes stop_codon:yes gene_type:complete